MEELANHILELANTSYKLVYLTLGWA